MQRDQPANFPHLNAQNIDLLTVSAQLDPFAALGGEVVAVVSSASRLFPDSFSEACKCGRFLSGDQSEYVRFVIRQFRVGKVHLTETVEVQADIFVIARPGGDTQLEIWDGGPIAEVSVLPPKPLLHANHGASTELGSSYGRPTCFGPRRQSFINSLYLLICSFSLAGPRCIETSVAECGWMSSGSTSIRPRALSVILPANSHQSAQLGPWVLGGVLSSHNLLWFIFACRLAFSWSSLLLMMAYLSTTICLLFRSPLTMS